MEQMAMNEKRCKNCGNSFPGGLDGDEKYLYCAEFYEQDGGNKEVDPDGFCSLGIWKEDNARDALKQERNALDAIDEIVENEHGGRQHKVEHRCEALFPVAQLEIARLRCEGFEKNGYDDENYRLIPPRVHIGRALRHILLWMTGDSAEDGSRDEHLVHAACRIEMAIEELFVHHNKEMAELRKEFGYDGRDKEDL